VADPSADVQGRIFISYRRDDTAYPAGWLYDRLVKRFGAEQIFKDVDSIELGDDFVAVLTEAVGSTDVLLALIGDKWLTITGEDGGRRLDDPEDFVRLEIEAALAQKVRVIPILVEGAEMPTADELPASLAPLSRRQALELSSSRFTFDSDRLLAVLERTFSGEKEPAPTDDGPSWRQRLRERPRLLLAVAGAAVLLLLAIGGAVVLSGRDDPEAGGLAGEDAAADDAASDDQAASDDSTSTESVPTPPANGPVAFVSDQTGSEEIWSLAPGEAEPTRLTRGFGDVRRPNWSPDGTKVAFASNRGNAASDFDIWVVDAAEGSTRRLTSGAAEDGAPAWSPDGTRIAFGRQEPGADTKDIWVMDADGGRLLQVTDDPADDDAPAWSTTNRIAFESNRDGDYEIHTLSPTGIERDVRQVTANVWADFSPDWSPDGRRIAYRALRGAESDIYTIAADGGRPRRLTDNGAINHRPSWSPDGSLIAFDSETDGQTDIFTVPANGGALQALISGRGNQDSASWGIAP
jgi:Tol biopolymer transport system component